MFKFNYSKMNRVLDNLKEGLNADESIDTKIDLFAGAIAFFEKSLDEATNLDNKLKIDYVNYFYRELYNMAVATNLLIVVEPLSDLILKNISKKLGNKKKNPYFNLMIDILIINALSFMQNNMVEGAKKYFTNAVEFGEKYINDSKNNYHDSLCCATNWLGYLFLCETNYNDALRYYEKTFELYNSVRELDGFYYKEYDPNDVNLKIVELKKILNN